MIHENCRAPVDGIFSQSCFINPGELLPWNALGNRNIQPNWEAVGICGGTLGLGQVQPRAIEQPDMMVRNRDSETTHQKLPLAV